MVALPCGSRSTTRTRRPRRDRPAARLTVVVVLPTPPFWLAMQKMRLIGDSSEESLQAPTLVGWQIGCGFTNPDQASLGVQTGNFETFHVKRLEAGRQLRHLVQRQLSLHRQPDPARHGQGLGQTDEV